MYQSEINAGCTNINVILLEAMIPMNNPSYEKTAVISIGFSIFQGLLQTHAFHIPWIELIAGILYGEEYVIFIVVLTAHHG